MTSEFARGQLRPRSLRHSDEVESVYPHVPRRPRCAQTRAEQAVLFDFCIGEELCTRRLNPKIFVVRTWFCSQNNGVCNPYTCESYLDDDM